MGITSLQSDQARWVGTRIACLGLLAVAAILFAPILIWGEPNELYEQLGALILPLIIGGVATVLAGRAFGPYAYRFVLEEQEAVQAILFAPLALLIGAMAASTANWLIHYKEMNFEAYFFGPFFWLCFFGIPLSLPFGFLFRNRLRRIARQNRV